VSKAGLLMVTCNIVIFLRSCTHCHAPFFIALFYYHERTVMRHFFTALFFWQESGRTRKGFGSRVLVPGPGSNPRSKGTNPLDTRRIQPQEFSNYQVVSLKKLYLFCNVHTRRCLTLHFWESSRDKKAIHFDTYVGFLRLSGGEKAIFLASVYLYYK
jgi:hypothetical protein